MRQVYNYNDSSNILKEHLEDIKKDLVKKYDELGMRASGQWEQSLELNVTGLKGVISGQPYTEQLVNGRPPGKFPPIAAIRQWILDKGINYLGKESNLNSLAFLIARKIAKEGTKYFKQGGTDLVSSVITPERIQLILDDVSYFHVNYMVSEITGLFENLKAA